MTERCSLNLLENLCAGDEEMCTLMRSFDWSQTPLGAMEQWPQSLLSAVSILLPSKAQICLFWGSEFITLYNDAYRPVLACKHPQALGQPAHECWSEIWHVLGPLLKGVMATGESFWAQDYPFFLGRHGYTEETYFDISYDPVRDESGAVGGVFCIVNETTQRVLSQRRLQTLRALATSTGDAKTVEDACRAAIETLSQNTHDIPFALLYQTDAERAQAQLVQTTGLPPGAAPQQVDLTQKNDVWCLAQAQSTGTAHQIDLTHLGGLLSAGLERAQAALVIPMTLSTQPQQFAGFLVMGISPWREFDDGYRGFFDLVTSNMATAIANACAYAAERKRAEALAELDRAKTVFFSNISHEFRTPLALMLAPLEDALSDLEAPLLPRQRERLEVIQRNGSRLLKLVNTLLDFSRIEAGRIEAVYAPLNLAALTTGIASMFRSLIERAGMSLVVECLPLPEPVYVDRDMWEKILLNLLSNAFKFTPSGTIIVRLRGFADRVELMVQDTGIGIPSDKIPHLFERFYRVKNVEGRDFEGSGIGLSLVQELVKLHGGKISVTSQLGQGSCFTVTLPTGFAHLPSDRLLQSGSLCPGGAQLLASTAVGTTLDVEAVRRWLAADAEIKNAEIKDEASKADQAVQPFCSALNAVPASARILLADDNADLRDYVLRLLQPRYQVEAVADGAAALAAIQQQLPDLVLADVMMPRLDGIALLRALRDDPQTRELPVILLSARAGEASRLAGLRMGADDYLIKPFSSQELLARVETHLKMTQIRREATEREQSLRLSAEKAQRDAEMISQRLTQILESMTDAFVMLDKDWRITYQNASAEQINGKPRSAVMGKTHWEEWPASAGSDIEKHYRRAIAEHTPVHFEYHYQVPPDYDVWLEIHAYPFVEGLGIFFRDITSRKQVEQALRERERLFTTLAEVAPVTIFRSDAANRCIYVNARWSDMTGMPVQAALGLEWMQILHPEDRDRLSATWRQWCRQAEPGALYQNEGRCIRSDGSVMWFYIQALPETDTDGATLGYVGVLTDITALKLAAADLKKSQMQLQQQLAEIEAIYQSAPIGLNVLDRNLRFLRINQRLAEMNGLPVEAHLGRTVREVLPDIADTAEQLLFPILETGEPLLNVEISGETPAQPGVYRTWLEHFLPLKDGDRVVGISTVCEEITERKRIEAERQQVEAALRQAKEELELRVIERTAELRQINTDLQQSESILRSFFNSGGMLMGIVELRDDGLFYISVNQATAEFMGTTPELLQNRSIFNPGISAELKQQWFDYYREAERLQAPIKFDYLSSGETPRWLAVSLCPIATSSSGYSRFSFIAKDVTARKQAEDRIQTSLKEKEVLLKEVHHRVKNNLAIVSSLLEMQSRRAHNPQINTILRDSQNRIDSIALVHEKLYRSEDLTNIDCAQYIQDLTASLFDSYNISSHEIALNIQVDRVALDIETAIPCGLIINELVTNALKYAFPDARAGEIGVSLAQARTQPGSSSQHELTLIVRDNGVGLPPDLNLQKTQTLGLTLVDGLVKQIQGTLAVERQSGTTFTINFMANGS